MMRTIWLVEELDSKHHLLALIFALICTILPSQIINKQKTNNNVKT